MSDKQDEWHESLGCVVIVLILACLILAFAGEPDMWDALIEKVRSG